MAFIIDWIVVQHFSQWPPFIPHDFPLWLSPKSRDGFSRGCLSGMVYFKFCLFLFLFAVVPEFQRPGGSFSHVRRQLFGSTSQAQNGSDDRNVMQPTHQIKDLNPYQNKFKIKARVVKKGDLRSWSNSRGQGQVFDLTLKDRSSQ